MGIYPRLLFVLFSGSDIYEIILFFYAHLHLHHFLISLLTWTALKTLNYPTPRKTWVFNRATWHLRSGMLSSPLLSQHAQYLRDRQNCCHSPMSRRPVFSWLCQSSWDWGQFQFFLKRAGNRAT